MKALQRRSNFGKPWPPTRRSSAGETKTSLRPPGPTRSARLHSGRPHTNSALRLLPSPSPTSPNAGHSASSFISRFASNLSSLYSEIHHLSFFFLFFHLSKLPRLALNYSVSSPSCAVAPCLTPLFCHPYPWPLTPLLIFFVRQESASSQCSAFPRCRLSGGIFH